MLIIGSTERNTQNILAHPWYLTGYLSMVSFMVSFRLSLMASFIFLFLFFITYKSYMDPGVHASPLSGGESCDTGSMVAHCLHDQCATGLSGCFSTHQGGPCGAASTAEGSSSAIFGAPNYLFEQPAAPLGGIIGEDSNSVTMARSLTSSSQTRVDRSDYATTEGGGLEGSATGSGHALETLNNTKPAVVRKVWGPSKVR